jgi:hypothetical protein
MPTVNTAHDHDYQAENARARYVEAGDDFRLWTPPHSADDLDANGRPPGPWMNNTEPCWRCWFCGSMPPDQLAAAIKAGATVSWADRKYGWPHKVYVEGVPNQFAGQLEIRGSTSTGRRPSDAEIEASKNDEHMGPWHEYQDGYDSRTGKPVMSWRRLDKPKPAAATSGGKFYTVHLKDATPEERVIIERAMGLSFTFEGDGVRWAAFQEPAAAHG